jgi:outer membrane immunogenic protein
MSRKIVFAGIAILATAASALAADLPSHRQAPPPYIPPPIFTWTGVYLGGQIGYEFGRDATYAPGLFPTVASSPNGVVGGAHIGYNYQVSQFVLGLEGDVNGASYSGSTFNPFRGTVLSSKVPVDGSIRGRIGFAVDRVLFYATGGAAFASIKDNYIGITSASVSNGRVGWTVGGGAEYAVTNNWSVRAEYRYTDYGNFSELPGTVIIPRIHRQTDNRVQAGFSYKFDTYAPPAPVLAKY